MNKKLLIGVPIVSIFLLFILWMPSLNKATYPAMAYEYSPEAEELTGGDIPNIRMLQPEEENNNIFAIILDLYKEIITTLTMTFNFILVVKQVKKKKEK